MASQVWRAFCRHGTLFIGCRRGRGAIMIGAARLSPVTNLVEGTGPAKAGVQTISKAEIYHGAGFQLRVDARVRVQRPLQICLGCRSKSKKCDKQLTFIVRVIGRLFFRLIYIGAHQEFYFLQLFSFLLTSTNQNCYVSVIHYTTYPLQLFRRRFYDL